MKDTIKNIHYLAMKEYKSLFTDKIMMILILTVYTVVILMINAGNKLEVNNAAVAIVDNDKSALSERIARSIAPPRFRLDHLDDPELMLGGLDRGDYTFALDIPEDFEKNLIAGKSPKIQLMVDATSMGQAGIGNAYLNDIIQREVDQSLQASGQGPGAPYKVEFRTPYNPSMDSAARQTITQTFLDTSILAILLVGAAIIREKEHGTIEHLLVMPVKAHEVAFAKILANGAVILITNVISMKLVVEGYLGIPIRGSLMLYALSALIFLFSASALGILLAILMPTMPQFGLASMLTIIVIHLITGVETPIESMPKFMQSAVQILPDTHFIKASVDIVFKGATLAEVWKEFLYMAAIGALFIWVALSIFRKMFEQQNV